MALICRHDILLFFANIDLPGEQQKYAIALIEHLFTLLLQEATVIALYDVGCVLSRSLSQWVCQLKYNPRMCNGLGLSDREGTERLWSRFVKLIGIQRSSSVSAIGLEMQTDLGNLIKQWLKHGVNGQGKKELDIVLTLQADLDALDRALQLTWTIVEKGSATEETLDALESLKHSHDHLMSKVETSYSSLNVHDRFPELQGIDLDFVRTLLMLHQQTRKAIAKCQLALMTVICKFNSYLSSNCCISTPSWGVLLPTPLPTKLTDLRKDQTLMEDVWITPSVEDVPRWIKDTDVRDGIQVLLKQERCHEEQHCIGLKADNLCQWFGAELAVLELALHSPTSKQFHLHR
ncbi:uncharacterized protein F5147DRAFT_743657 [Suillus discolor]|uniref:Uncharacterized protein n=1 Tax=Suillus discolor TaxID=1912936 RepID=A0A9P7FEF4_9AGAM|nr:uncharacterized protein F5147DRAFT_743657 [Suillus discolor]KAG2115165.1 hypothetical protein F5147DRAFT_743657 [Suillus discolor]